MKIAFRLKEEIGASLDSAASAEGLNRSQWIRRLIERELEAAPSEPSRLTSLTAPRSKLTIRIDAGTLTRLDDLATGLGMRRNQWIMQAIRARVWDKNGDLLDYPITAKEVGQIVTEIVRIGRNVNQAVHAINAAAMPGSELNLAQATEPMLKMKQDIATAIDNAERQLVEFAWKENRYWRGSDLR